METYLARPKIPYHRINHKNNSKQRVARASNRIPPQLLTKSPLKKDNK